MLITADDLLTLARGSEFLGSGGGGNSSILLPLSEATLKKCGPVKLLQIEELKENDLIVPVAMVGAPSAMDENKDELNFLRLIQVIKEEFSEKNIVLMPAEIGGCNALAPFAVAACLNLPILDADLIGRAFPKVSMCVPAILGGCLGVAYIANREGEIACFSYNDVKELERMARQKAVEFGGSAVIATYLYEFSPELKNRVIPGSVSLALTLGKQSQQGIPKENLHVRGQVTALTTYLENGFLFGKVTISMITEGNTEDYHVYFQNEFLLCINKNKVVVESPTLIILLNSVTRTPIASELLALGQQVEIISFRAHNFWYEKDYCKQVSKEAFDFVISLKRSIDLDCLDLLLTTKHTYSEH